MCSFQLRDQIVPCLGSGLPDAIQHSLWRQAEDSRCKLKEGWKHFFQFTENLATRRQVRHECHQGCVPMLLSLRHQLFGKKIIQDTEGNASDFTLFAQQVVQYISLKLVVKLRENPPEVIVI